MMFANSYHNKRILVTGHTGFKGSWLCLWLRHLGAEVIGFSIDVPTTPAHFDMLDLKLDDRRGDVRDSNAIQKVIQETQPDLVFHLAAFPLVRESYAKPLETFATNIMGTAHVLQGCRGAKSVQGIVVITSDKCYENTNKSTGYVENDPMGGYDPYSASKGCAELVVASYARAFADLPPVASARAGNVVGGGDWADDRLIPDAVRAMEQHKKLMIRSPHAVRPWQHVLEPLSAYLLLGQHFLEGNVAAAGGWNFAPDDTGILSVSDVLDMLKTHMPFTYGVEDSSTQNVHEAALLTLNSDKAKKELGWAPVWNAKTMLAHTADWYKAHFESQTILSLQQLALYEGAAKKMHLAWAK